jgi:hypothetical protein
VALLSAVLLGVMGPLAIEAQAAPTLVPDSSPSIAAYAGLIYGELAWQADPQRPVGINLKGALRNGHSAWRRGL